MLKFMRTGISGFGGWVYVKAVHLAEDFEIRGGFGRTSSNAWNRRSTIGDAKH